MPMLFQDYQPSDRTDAAATAQRTDATAQRTVEPSRDLTRRVFSPAVGITFTPYVEEQAAQQEMQQSINPWLLILGGVVAYNAFKGK